MEHVALGRTYALDVFGSRRCVSTNLKKEIGGNVTHCVVRKGYWIRLVNR